MSAHALTPRLRWLFAAAGAVAAMLPIALLFLLSRIPVLSPSVVSPPIPVKLAAPGPANPLMQEDMAMHDLAPLFLPTSRNATLGRLPRIDLGRTLLDQEAAKLSLDPAEMHFERDLPPAPPLNGKPVTAAKPADALTAPATAPTVLAFGRSELPVTPLERRGAYVEVVSVATGELLFTNELDLKAKPPGEKPWAPVQFVASVGPAGLVGPLILTERSGVEEVDQHFRFYLAQTYRIGHRLPPGIYRITVGP